ncbi:MAG: condensation domain-containing protein [Candidatus Margulisbacteria bacterium]|nr:condensation domain-containing protein [Candidatus Margulisiibacteriota bacterium]
MEKYSLSFQQEEMWIAEQFYSTGSLFNIGGYCKLDAEINHQILEKAISIALNSYSNFKAHILVDDDGVPYQVFDDFVAFDYEFIDYLVDDKSAMDWMQKKMDSSLLSKENKLIYVATIKTTQTQFYFLKIHHLLSDFFGVKIMLNKMMTVYQQLIENINPAIFTTQESDYRDYLIVQKEYINSITWLKDKEYWQRELNIKEKDLSLSSPINNADFKSNVKYMVIDNFKKERLTAIAKEHNVSDFVFWLYLVGVTFCEMDASSCYYLGVHFLNRLNRKEKNNPGLFTNSLPIKISNSEFKKDIFDLSKRVRQAFRHQQFPIRKLSLSTDFYSVIVSFESYQKSEDIYGYTLKSKESVCPITFYIDNHQIQLVYHKSIGEEKINEVISSLWETINRVIC